MRNDLVFIQGPEKTATSTMTGILNCHPEIFILFETYLAQIEITKYGNQLLERYPEARQFFRNDEDYGAPVSDFFDFLQEREPDYSYIYKGTKINSLNPDLTQKVHPYKVIFTMRDLKSWLIKESVIKRYRTDMDVVKPAMEYLKYIITCRKHTHAHIVWMEDLIESNGESIKKLGSYLNVDLHSHAESWWEQFGAWEGDNPKSVFRLGHVHHSSKVKPEKLDSSYEITKHPFWVEAGRIFDKYYRNSDPDLVSESDMKEDLEFVESLGKHSPLPLEEGYSMVHSVRFGYKAPREIYHLSEKNKEGKKRSIFSKVYRRLKRAVDVAIGDQSFNKKWTIPLVFYDEARLAVEMIYIFQSGVFY